MESTRRVQGDTPRFVDKLPQNYFYIPIILKALPNARIVHLMRDPMDACFASYKQLFADAYLHSYDLEEMARHHCRYRRLMDVWRERFPGRFLDISYEQTVYRPRPQCAPTDRFPRPALGRRLPAFPRTETGRIDGQRGAGARTGPYAVDRTLAEIRGPAAADEKGSRTKRSRNRPSCSVLIFVRVSSQSLLNLLARPTGIRRRSTGGIQGDL